MMRATFLLTLAVAAILTAPHASAVDSLATAKALTSDTVKVMTTVDGRFVGDVLPLCDDDGEAEGTVVGTINQELQCFLLTPNEISTDDLPFPICPPYRIGLLTNGTPPVHAEPREDCIYGILGSIHDRLNDLPLPVRIAVTIPR